MVFLPGERADYGWFVAPLDGKLTFIARRDAICAGAPVGAPDEAPVVQRVGAKCLVQAQASPTPAHATGRQPERFGTYFREARLADTCRMHKHSRLNWSGT